MKNSSALLAALRELPTMVRTTVRTTVQTIGGGPSPERVRETYSFPGLSESPECPEYGDGLPKGALVEISGEAGSGKTELLLECLARSGETRVAWVEQGFTVYPSAFPQKGVRLGRVLFVDALSEEQALWSIQQMIRSGLFGIGVLVVPRLTNTIVLRRLQLAAERAQATIVLVQEQAVTEGAWPIALQLRISRPHARPVVHVLRRRGEWTHSAQAATPAS